MSWSIYTVVIAISVVHGQNFRRCYETNNKYYCFYIDGSTSSWTDARQFCRNSNSTLPIITDANIQSVFEQFLYDSNSTRPAWIAAHTIDVNNSSNKWHWIDGSSTNLTPTPSNNDMFYPKWCSAVRNNTASSNRLLLEESAWVSSPPYYICQFNDITNCSTSGFMYNSKCYKYYNELVQGPWYSRWFTAVNKCLFKNGSLAVFDDNFLTTVSLPWLSSTSDGYYQAWIGLTKSWWIWSDTATNCVSTGGFVYNSKCYKYYKENVTINTMGTFYSRWFTAVNRCLSKNGSLAVFDDNFLTNISLPWLGSNSFYDQAWIGFIRSWWTWQDAGETITDVLYNKFNTSEGMIAQLGPPYNPPLTPSSTEYCAVAGPTGYWQVDNCDTERRQVICQSVSAVLFPSTTQIQTSATTTPTTPTPFAPSTSTTATTMNENARLATETHSRGVKTAAIALGVLFGVSLTVIILLVVFVLHLRNTIKQQHTRNNDRQSMKFVNNNNNSTAATESTSESTNNNTASDLTDTSNYQPLKLPANSANVQTLYEQLRP